jgi:hypothetical protein
MKYNDFTHIGVSGDGACFFHSIAAILIKDGNPIEIDGKLITEKNRGKLATRLRAECIKWLRANLDYKIKGIERTIAQEIQSEIDSGGLDKKVKNVGKYLTYMSRYDSYAGQIEIYGMSNLLNRNIRVYIHNKGKFSNVGLGYEVKNKDIMDDIFLYHNLGKTKSRGSHHFDALYPKVKDKNNNKKNKSQGKSTRKTTGKTTRKTNRKTTRKSTRKTTRKSTIKTTRKSTIKRKMNAPRKSKRRTRRITRK